MPGFSKWSFPGAGGPALTPLRAGRCHAVRMGRSDPYYRNNAVGVAHLQMAGHTGARAEGWGGGTEGIVVPHPNGVHNVEVGASPDERDGTWNMRLLRHGDDPGYEQEGLKLGNRTQMPRVPSRDPKELLRGDDAYSSTVIAHPRELPDHVQAFIDHPDVRRAAREDMLKRTGGTGNLGPQFGPRGGS